MMRYGLFVVLWLAAGGCGGEPSLTPESKPIKDIANAVFYTYEFLDSRNAIPDEVRSAGIGERIQFLVEKKGYGVRELLEGIVDGSSPITDVVDEIDYRLRSGMQGEGKEAVLVILSCGWALEMWEDIKDTLEAMSGGNRMEAIRVSFRGLLDYADYLERKYAKMDRSGDRYRLMESALLGWLCLADHLNEKGFDGIPGYSDVMMLVYMTVPEVRQILSDAANMAMNLPDSLDAISLQIGGEGGN